MRRPPLLRGYTGTPKVEELDRVIPRDFLQDLVAADVDEVGDCPKLRLLPVLLLVFALADKLGRDELVAVDVEGFGDLHLRSADTAKDGCRPPQIGRAPCREGVGQ